MARRRIEATVADEVRMFFAHHDNWTPTQVHRVVNRVHGIEVGRPGDGQEVISLRTVQRIRADMTADESGLWSVLEGDLEDVAVVAPFVRMTLDERKPPLTRQQAGYITRILRAYPDISPPRAVLVLATVASLGEQMTGWVETWLALTPWRDDKRALLEAIRRNLVGPELGLLDVMWASDSKEWAARMERAIPSSRSCCVGGQRRVWRRFIAEVRHE